MLHPYHHAPDTYSTLDRVPVFAPATSSSCRHRAVSSTAGGRAASRWWCLSLGALLPAGRFAVDRNEFSCASPGWATARTPQSSVVQAPRSVGSQAISTQTAGERTAGTVDGDRAPGGRSCPARSDVDTNDQAGHLHRVPQPRKCTGTAVSHRRHSVDASQVTLHHSCGVRLVRGRVQVPSTWPIRFVRAARQHANGAQQTGRRCGAVRAAAAPNIKSRSPGSPAPPPRRVPPPSAMITPTRW